MALEPLGLILIAMVVAGVLAATICSVALIITRLFREDDDDEER